MVWNTIAHPKMMHSDETITFSPIKFADPHKLSFYDIVVTRTDTTDDMHLILVRGDFETIKKMLLNGEAVCGAIFMSHHYDGVANLIKMEFESFSYNGASNVITLLTSLNGDPMYLLSDNTISTTDPNAVDDLVFDDPTSPGALGEP